MPFFTEAYLCSFLEIPFPFTQCIENGAKCTLSILGFDCPGTDFCCNIPATDADQIVECETVTIPPNPLVTITVTPVCLPYVSNACLASSGLGRCDVGYYCCVVPT